ncbi:MAG: hypothetical protein MUC43_03245 [Pirellula sp.]|jgi:phosphonate degradation associated HDIG domain protein|nr:hypothetical protein [Pirellula sp.]
MLIRPKPESATDIVDDFALARLWLRTITFYRPTGFIDQDRPSLHIDHHRTFLNSTRCMQPTPENIIALYRQRGTEIYGDEKVTQAEHAIQSAVLAERQGAVDSQIVAALLHDIGHILGEDKLPASDLENLDDGHENRAYHWLCEHFGREVADPIRLHVAAKRYLCTVTPDYCETLSPTSYKSYLDQGGPMSEAELQEFRQEPFFEQAIALRRWDDQAKDSEMVIPDISFFSERLQASLDRSRSVR